jgi:hypothetical protein
MDWSQEEAGSPAKEESVLLPPASAELQELSFSLLPSLNNSGRRLGRKISHKKSASDTFAFAAGQDFLALLSEKPPLEPVGHARHASSGAGLAGSPSADTDQQMTTDAAQEVSYVYLQMVCCASGMLCVCQHDRVVALSWGLVDGSGFAKHFIFCKGPCLCLTRSMCVCCMYPCAGWELGLGKTM